MYDGAGAAVAAVDLWVTGILHRCGKDVDGLWAACLSMDRPHLFHGGAPVIHKSTACSGK